MGIVLRVNDRLGLWPNAERPPLRAGDDARHQVEREDALRSLVVAVDGKGDALREKRPIGLDLALAQLDARRRAQFVEERAAVGPRRSRSRS
jgi:hypothetical protein